MSRTVGRKIRPGERRRIQCSHCNALFDKRELRRDSDGLWTCQQEGPGRASVELTRGNAEALRQYANRLRTPGEITGRYGDVAVGEISARTGNILTEAGHALLTEDGDFLSVEAGQDGLATESALSFFTEGGSALLAE